MENDPSQDPDERREEWAKPVPRLKVTAPIPEDGMNLNVEGRQVNGPMQGFGQLWQKKYRIRLIGSQASPKEVIRTWKEHFPEFWPEGNRFYGPLRGIEPGEVAVLNLAVVPGVKIPVLSTGVMVIYADDVSFTFMTPEGHMFCGFITFSSFDDDGVTIAQVEVMVRATDPIYEIGMRLAGSAEDKFWQETLKSLGKRFGAEGHVETRVSLLDPQVQWSKAKNIWKNAAIRTAAYLAVSPFRWAGNLIKGKRNSE